MIKSLQIALDRIISILKKAAIKTFAVAFVLLGAYAFYFMQHIHFKRSFGENLVETTTEYQRAEGDEGAILVIGDSLAYGIGASTPEKSFAGLLGARFPGYAIINKAVVGYDVEDLADNIDDLIDKRYDAVFIMVGGNDIIRFKTDLNGSIEHLSKVYSISSIKAETVYLITSGDFRTVSMVPWGLKSYFSDRSNQLRLAAILQADSFDNATYIDAFNLSQKDYAKLEAGDGFHLNDEGIVALTSLILESYDANAILSNGEQLAP